MAKHSKPRRDHNSPIANDSSLSRLLTEPVRPTRPLVSVSPSTVNLRELEDRRLFHPDPVRPARNLSSEVHRLVAPEFVPKRAFKRDPRTGKMKAYRINQPQAVFGRSGQVFQEAQRVLICIRRAMRVEVLHALKKTGRGGAKRRKPRRNEYSHIRCK